MRLAKKRDGGGESPDPPVGAKVERRVGARTSDGELDDTAGVPTVQPADSSQGPMANVRPQNAVGAPLARARGFGALFGEQGSGASFQRFLVRGRLGAGGMGVVYEAYDPSLTRGVALKLVAVDAPQRASAFAEAQALARLSHPHVVPIYDVGLEGDHVFLVMELVRGETLRTWVDGRTQRDILAMYQQAGLALAAAHKAGLVHRDFKPDNAIVGSDGRLRVVDFGLACEAEDPEALPCGPCRAAGTPRFMAPEIKAGAAVTSAADQYSFCVALADSLEQARCPPSRRIAAVLDRGRAADPKQRFASMAELLRALARDPARTRRRLATSVGLTISVSALAFFVGRRDLAAPPDPYEDGVARLEVAWGKVARSAALARLDTLGPPGRSLRPLLARMLDGYIAHWLNQYRDAGLERRRGFETVAMSDRRATCLWRGRDALAVVGQLISRAAPENLAELPRAVQSMPDPGACSDLEALMSDIAPPPPALAAEISQVRRQITQAEVLVGAGRYVDAYAQAGTAVLAARKLGFEPVLASALLVHGHARMNLPDRDQAVPILTEAWKVAMTARADAVAVEAWARRVYAQTTSAAPDAATDAATAGAETMELIAHRTASAGFARALFYNNLGNAELARERRSVARAYFERALAESRNAEGRGTLELIAIRANIGLVTDDRGRGDALLVDAESELARRLGPDHPDTLEIRRLRGFSTIDDLHRAVEILTPVCRAYERIATLADRTARCWTEVGLLRWDLGEPGGAIEILKAAVMASPRVPEAAAYLALLQHDASTAARLFRDGVAANAPSPGEHWWDRLQRARFLLGEARARRAMGDLQGARRQLEQSVADLVEICRAHPAASHERRLGRARVELARTLAEQGVPAAKRDEVTTQAAQWLRRVGADQGELRIRNR